MRPPDAVLKIGGSLGRGQRLEGLCREIGRLGAGHSLLVVPGGGEFADKVREAYRTFNLGETAAHSMALLAMDQFGHLLHDLIDNSSLHTEIGSAVGALEAGGVAVLLPSIQVLRDSVLPHTWEVTSDSVAAWVARESGCRKLVLLKDVDGLFPPGEFPDSGPDCIGEMTVGRLKEHSGGVDQHLAGFLASERIEAWIISGLRYERLGELLDFGSTTGTRIIPALV
jgi:aspartokinase-like uncharacterized kinase